MNVAELKQLLANAPDEYEVQTEGCDCWGDVKDIRSSDTKRQVVLCRSDRAFPSWLKNFRIVKKTADV